MKLDRPSAIETIENRYRAVFQEIDGQGESKSAKSLRAKKMRRVARQNMRREI